MKDWIEKPIKRLLYKRLKKRIYAADPDKSTFSSNEMVDWIYNAPLREWKDRIWCAEQEKCFTLKAKSLYEDYINVKPPK